MHGTVEIGTVSNVETVLSFSLNAIKTARLLIAAGADLKSVNPYGGTALTPAAHHGHVDVVRYLVTTPIDVNQINDLGWTALEHAMAKAHSAIADLLRQ